MCFAKTLVIIFTSTPNLRDAYFWKNGSSGTKGMCVSFLGFSSTYSPWTDKLTLVASCGYCVISECARLFQQPLPAIHHLGKGIFC